MVSVSRGNTIRVWNLSTRKALRPKKAIAEDHTPLFSFRMAELLFPEGRIM
jgi:hypothetical protein